MRRAWGIDVSDYQPVLDYQTLVDAGLTFVIVKTSMGYGNTTRAAAHIAAIRRTTAKLGIYHWADPTASCIAQVDRFAERIRTFRPDFLCADNEQWWANWTEWNHWQRGLITAAQVSRFEGRVLSGFYRNFMCRVRDRFPDLLQYNYTAKWFISGFAPDMSNWANEFPLHLAAYVTRRSKQFPNWEEFYRVLDSLTHPSLPLKATGYGMWQWTSSWRLPGFNFNLDTNISRDTQEQFIANLHGGYVPDPPPVVPNPSYTLYKVTAPRGLWVRTGPSELMARDGSVRYPQIVKVYEVRQGENYKWARIDPVLNKWIAMTWIIPCP